MPQNVIMFPAPSRPGVEVADASKAESEETMKKNMSKDDGTTTSTTTTFNVFNDDEVFENYIEIVGEQSLNDMADMGSFKEEIVENKGDESLKTFEILENDKKDTITEAAVVMVCDKKDQSEEQPQNIGTILDEKPSQESPATVEVTVDVPVDMAKVVHIEVGNLENVANDTIKDLQMPKCKEENVGLSTVPHQASDVKTLEPTDGQERNLSDDKESTTTNQVDESKNIPSINEVPITEKTLTTSPRATSKDVEKLEGEQNPPQSLDSFSNTAALVETSKPENIPVEEIVFHRKPPKERFTLPPKKQVTKFKQYEISSPTNDTMELSKNVAGTTTKPSTPSTATASLVETKTSVDTSVDALSKSNLIIQNVSVETSTLLDILRAVEQQQQQPQQQQQQYSIRKADIKDHDLSDEPQSSAEKEEDVRSHFCEDEAERFATGEVRPENEKLSHANLNREQPDLKELRGEKIQKEEQKESHLEKPSKSAFEPEKPQQKELEPEKPQKQKLELEKAQQKKLKSEEPPQPKEQEKLLQSELEVAQAHESISREKDFGSNDQSAILPAVVATTAINATQQSPEIVEPTTTMHANFGPKDFASSSSSIPKDDFEINTSSLSSTTTKLEEHHHLERQSIVPVPLKVTHPEEEPKSITISAEPPVRRGRKPKNKTSVEPSPSVADKSRKSETPKENVKKARKIKSAKERTLNSVHPIGEASDDSLHESNRSEKKNLESKASQPTKIENGDATNMAGEQPPLQQSESGNASIKANVNVPLGDELKSLPKDKEKERQPKPPPKKRVFKMPPELMEGSEKPIIEPTVGGDDASVRKSKSETFEESEKVISKVGKLKKSITSSSGEENEEKNKLELPRDIEKGEKESSSAAMAPAVAASLSSTSVTPSPKRSKSKKTTDSAKSKSKGKTSPSISISTSTPKEAERKGKESHKQKSASTKKSEKKKFLEIEEKTSKDLSKKSEENSAKKKRQKKLKEAFEAALNEEDAKKAASENESVKAVAPEMKAETPAPAPTPPSPPPMTPLTPAPSLHSDATDDVAPEPLMEDDKKASVEAETEAGNTDPLPLASEESINEMPDPLKDIEKFIEDGVNLLKRDAFKIDDDDPVDCGVVVMATKTLNDDKTVGVENFEELAPSFKSEEATIGDTLSTCVPLEMDVNETKQQQPLFETPADTPVATPTPTPPPKSPISDLSTTTTTNNNNNNNNADEFCGVRRSHRIKQITKTPKALVGRGLVREKERLSMKDDIEMKTHYSLDDHLMDLAEVEAKNAKFLKDMEERLSNFHVIKENEYKCERIVSREARKMICDCFLTSDEEGRGELGCGEDCLNRLLMIECGPDCNVKDRCTNKRFQKLLCSPCRVFRTEKKGFGIMADIEIHPGEFIMEYVGEVIDGDEFERRRTVYSLDKNRHYYFMALRSDAIIDATIKGNISRFINHSCDPNAETQKWTVNGELRIGFFSRKTIMPGEEITFDYQYQRYGREAQRCYCESANCRGWIGEEPNSDEGEQIDEDSDVDNLADSLLDSEDEDSDESVADAEEVQKRLEKAAAEAKLMPMSDEHKTKFDGVKDKKKKVGLVDDDRRELDEDSKSKFKKLLSKISEKVAYKKKQSQKDKKQRKRRTPASGDVGGSKSRYLEDPDIEDEVNFLSRCGLKNQLDTLRLSRLMVRAKLTQTRLNLMQILRKGELPCRRLFLDYHGLRLLHGWMSEDGGDMNIRMSLLETLECLPIANKTVLTDSKVYQAVHSWCSSGPATLSPTDDSSKESSSTGGSQQPEGVPENISPTNANATATVAVAASAQELPSELQKLALKLTSTWDSLPEIFRIPKRERIEQMKEHEREADRQYAAAAEDSSRSSMSDRYQRDRFGRGLSSRFSKPNSSKDMRTITTVGTGLPVDPRRRSALDNTTTSGRHLSKEQRRELFAAKVARDEAEKRLAEERREFDTKCRFFGLDPKKTRPHELPFCVNPATGQWYSVDRQPIPTPPSYAHVQVPVKPKSTNPIDYQLPAIVTTLPPEWKFAITPQGNIYYYHVKLRVPQWEPPTPAQIYGSQTGANDSESESNDEENHSTEEENDETLLGMDQLQLKAYIEKRIEMRRQKRYTRLVDERPISPRKEEDRVYNQIEVRKYKENKEKIRKRKEEIRRKRAEALKNSVINMCTLGSVELSAATGQTLSTETKSMGKSLSGNGSNEETAADALPIQDYLLSSDEEETIKAECNNSPLLDKIVQGDKIVDELDALTTKRVLKRPLPPHRELGTHASTSGGGSSSSSGMSALEKHEYKKRRLEKKEKSRKSRESDSKYRKLKEKFRCEIAGIIVQHLKPYYKESCFMGRIQSEEDFNHLARKLTHFVMIKELKYCESVGQTLVVTESVKNKSREFIKKYMAKYGDVYVKPKNDPEFKEIPFSL